MTTNTGLLLSPFPWAPDKPSTNGNQYWASCNFYLPLSQRLELLVVAPFIASNTTSPGGPYVANFGDLTISERCAWWSRGTSRCKRCSRRGLPPGRRSTAMTSTSSPRLSSSGGISPPGGCSRGTGINIDAGRRSATDTYMTNMAIGRYVTRKDAAIFKQAVAHVAVATMSDVLGRKEHITEVYVAGMRFRLDRQQQMVRPICDPGSSRRAPSLCFPARFRSRASALSLPVPSSIIQ